MKIFVFVTVSILSYIRCFSQDSISSHSLSISANFSPMPVMQIIGTDTSYHNALSISPSLNFKGRNGWGLRYSPAIITSGSNPGIYMHTISAGFQNKGYKNVDLSFTYSHFFISKNSNIPFTPLHNEVYFSVDYTKKWLQPEISGSMGFGKSENTSSSFAYDISFSGGFSHDFGWDDVGIFSYIGISPAVLLNAGTNEYFSLLRASKYLSTKKFDSFVKNDTKEKSSNTSSPPNFEFRNIEMYLETTFEAGSFSITPSGSLFLPVSGTYKSLDGYWQVSLKYDF